jgi:hypothetical protein
LRRLWLPTTLLACTLGLAGSASAGNRVTACGGVGQRACCVVEAFPSCDSGLIEKVGVGPGAGDACPFGVSLGTCYNPGFPPQCGDQNERDCELSEHFQDCKAGLTSVSGICRDTGTDFPADCGRKDQLACTIFQHIPSCQTGLVELLAGFEGSFCREIGIDGFPTHCGHDHQRPCRISEHIPSCSDSLVEFGGECRVSDELFPDACGDQDERACTLIEHIPSCKSGLVELFNLSGGSICRRFAADGFPTHCGGGGEPACQVLEHIPSCKPDAYEVATPHLPALANGWCVEEEDFSSAPFRLDRPVEQVPPGPRTIFLLHGAAGDRNGLSLNPLHEPERGFVRYWVDANWSGAEGSDEDPVGVRIFDADQKRDDGDVGETPLCNKGTRIDGFTYSVPLTSRWLRDALLDQTNCRDPENPPPPGPVENVTLVAHSMGGILARDLVYRHYDELLANGVRIAEVVTLGSPHRGGGSGIPELTNAQWASCIVSIFSEQLHATCMMENWQARLRDERARRDQGGAPYIDNLDFPGIRWITLATSDAVQPTNAILTDPITAHDNLVAHVSAFGPAVDLCFPNVDSEPPPAEITDRSAPNLGESEAWIEHFWPPQITTRSTTVAPSYEYNPYNGLDVSPAALVTSVATNAVGSLTAACHGPGPSSERPDIRYLAGVNAPDAADPTQQGERFLFLGDTGHPHGDIAGGSDYANVTVNYIRTVLTDGLRGGDVDGNGVIDAADRDRLVSQFPGNDPPAFDANFNGVIEQSEDPGPPPSSAFEDGFDTWSDLDGDGFVTLVDLQQWYAFAASDLSAPAAAAEESAEEPAVEPSPRGCGLLGVEPLLLLGGLALLRRRMRQRTLAIGLVLLLAGLLSTRPAGAAALLEIQPSATTVALGETFSIELRADLGLPVLAFGFDLHWDDDRLDYLGPAVFAPGWMQLANAMGAPAEPFPELARVDLGALATPSAAAGLNLLLATLSFRARSLGSAHLELSITPADLTEGFALLTPGSFDTFALAGAQVSVVPEPHTALLLAAGLFGLGVRFRRRAGG